MRSRSSPASATAVTSKYVEWTNAPSRSRLARRAVQVLDRQRHVAHVEVEREPVQHEHERGQADEHDQAQRVPRDLAQLLARDGPGLPHASAAAPRRAASASSTWWMNTSSSDGTIRSTCVGRVARRGQRVLHQPRPALRVLHHHVQARAEDRDLARPGRAVQHVERVGGTRTRDLEHRVAGEHLLELRHAAQRGQPAGVDEGQAMAVLRLLQVVRGDEHRHAGRGHLVDERPEAAAGEGIDAARGLVQEDDARAVQDRAREGQLLPPAAGQLARQAMLLPAQARHLDRPLLPLARGGTPQAVHAAEEADVLQRRQVLVQAEALAHVADAALHALRVPRDVDAQHARGAAGGAQQAAHHADRRGLARTVRAQEAEDLALPHVEGEAPDRHEVAEALREVSQLDRGRHRVSVPSRAGAPRRPGAQRPGPKSARGPRAAGRPRRPAAPRTGSRPRDSGRRRPGGSPSPSRARDRPG